MSIYVSGLRVYDGTKDIALRNKTGKSCLKFGLEYSEVDYPLPFRYLATDSISSFQAIKLDYLGNEIETVTLETSLITSDGSYHTCSGLTRYSDFLDNCIYYFVINSRYKSEPFHVVTTRQGVGFDIIESTLIVYSE